MFFFFFLYFLKDLTAFAVVLDANLTGAEARRFLELAHVEVVLTVAAAHGFGAHVVAEAETLGFTHAAVGSSVQAGLADSSVLTHHAGAGVPFAFRIFITRSCSRRQGGEDSDEEEEEGEEGVDMR